MLSLHPRGSGAAAGTWRVGSLWPPILRSSPGHGVPRGHCPPWGVAAGSVTCEALWQRGRNPSSESEQTSPRKPGETACNEAINYPQRLRATPGAQETQLSHGTRPRPAGTAAAEALSHSWCKARVSFLYPIYKHTVSLPELM